MKISFAILLTFVLLWNLSCSTRRIVKLPPTATVPEILNKVIERDAKIKGLVGEGTVTFESPEVSTSGFFTARIKKPDSLLFEVRGPFGIRVGTLSVSGGKYIFYDWLENRAVGGNADKHTLMNLLRVPLDVDAVFRVFTGEFFISDSAEKLLSHSSGDKAWHLTFQSTDGTNEYWIDYESFVVTGYRRIDNDGAQVMTATVSEIEEVDDIYCGKVVRIVLPQTHHSVTVAYDDISVNSPFTCYFHPPNKAKIIYQR